MLGGDQFKNNLGNQVIIKCHECGDTNLRYVGFDRTQDGDPSGYVCGNGHETWGAVDDWDIWGQTDVPQSKVVDKTCESLMCKLPKSINVQFSGIAGVQARESCAHNIPDDIRSRTSMPITLCGPTCCSSDYDPSNNDPWTIDCGCDTINGPCSRSDDGSDVDAYPSCISDILTTTTTCLGLTVTASIDKDSIEVYTNVPAGPINGSPGDSPFSTTWAGLGTSCGGINNPACCFFTTSDYIVSPGFFAGGYPENYSANGPSFITRLTGSQGDVWENSGRSVLFIVREQTHFEYLDPCDQSAGCCKAFKRTYYVATRNHPTADATGNSGFTWTVSQQGIGTTTVEGSCGNCSASWESPNINPYSFVNFCNPSNAAFSCTNCNDSIGEITTSLCEGDGSRRFWPYRVPYYKNTNNSDYQLVRKNPEKYPTYGECNCIGSPDCDNLGPVIFPDFCKKNIAYPDCLANGTYKCKDEDSRYRVDCKNPDDYFLTSLVNAGSDSILKYRYTIDLGGFTSTSNIDDALVVFNPIWAGREPGVNGADTFYYPVSPNPVCAGLARVGYVPNFGDPNPIIPEPLHWYDIGHPTYPSGGAIGIRTAKFGQLWAGANDIVQQPHCLRRVRNPNLAEFYPFYQVYTGDVSKQRMILDRYFQTSDSYDYSWSGVYLAESGIAQQAFISNQGDKGNIDYLSGQLYPYAFMARSGSIEEPELVAVIHSDKGRGGQIAFQTMPVSYETDELSEPADNLKASNGYCKYKTRITAQGYGVMYPLIDDPIWNSTETIPFPDTYTSGWQPTTGKKNFEYPVFIPGTGYEIGDKIEFRSWRTLQHDGYTLDIDGNPLPDEFESIWEEECIETIIATATITELNDERVAPSKVQPIPSGANAILDIQQSGTERYSETWKVAEASINGGTGYNINDVIDIRFSDNDGLSGVTYEVYPSAIVIQTGINGSIIDTNLVEPGIFYKIIRTGGIRWYEFDETDDNGDLLISVGNCPCSFDLCSEDCIGCVSKNMYPNTHETLEAIQGGFPGPPNTGCVTIEGIEDGNIPPEKIILFCPSSNPYVAGNGTCAYTGRYASTDIGSLGWMLLNANKCEDDYICSPAPAGTPTYNQKTTASCYCIKPATSVGGVSVVHISGWSNLTIAPLCWPLNTTMDFYSENYARSACSGTPEISGFRAYPEGDSIIPYRRPQYKQVWIPNVSGFMANFATYMPDFDDATKEEEAKEAVKEAFLSYDACNPGKYDKFNRSYKWLTQYDSGKPPCRKKLVPTDPIPSGNHIITPRTLDNYCRVYGFYQQRQPSCNVLYRGQYIMRAGYKAPWTPSGPQLGDCASTKFPNQGYEFSDCQPIISNINIGLNKLEAQFDVSLGAPYEQDYIIPEQLPAPIIGPDGFLESRAYSWDYPSLLGSGNTRLFDHGFYEPNRYSDVRQMALPENQGVLTAGGQPILSPVLTINPLFSMPDVDGHDMNPIDMANSGIQDWPDPRSNCISGCNQYVLPLSQLYPSGNVPLPESGIQSNFIFNCLYPWENLRKTDDVDHYCMFKNNSAELSLGEIEKCDNCIGSVLIYDRSLNGLPGPFYDEYGDYINFTHIVLYHTETGVDDEGDDVVLDYYLLFRAFGNNNNAFTKNSFVSVIDDYTETWVDRLNNPGVNLYQILLSDTHRTILWNMLFEGAINDKLDGLTKVEILAIKIETKTDSYYSTSKVAGFIKLYSEDRCEFNQKTGSIKSINVLNPGAGYAFEIEERVPPSGIVQNFEEAIITINTAPKNIDRRRETYAVSDVNIIHSGLGVSIGQIIDIEFDDKDLARDKVYIISKPQIIITDVDDDGKIIDWDLANSGEFYKYMKTGVHRAFPVATILNNYWDYPNGQQNFGRHARIVPIVGVDPKDEKTYGKIKRVDVEFGGIEYVEPGQYWAISTTMGSYDDYGNIKDGLDVQHLVDPCKYKIYGSGFNSDQILEYEKWLSTAENDPNGTIYFPEEMAYYNQSPNEEVEPSIGNPFTRSIKYYFKTNANPPVTWQEKVASWDTVIVSGYCPVDSSGGLLNRSYGMALVEESILHSNRPIPSPCSQQLCSQLINYSDTSCTQDINAVLPNNENIKNCGKPCPHFTVYDAHRFNIAHTSQMSENIYALPTPWLVGCSQRLPLDTEEKRMAFCYNAYQVAHGGTMSTQGFAEWSMMNNGNDKCKDAIYSLYAEFGKWFRENSKNNPIMRAKSITYAMEGPITMKISYNDPRTDRPINFTECEDPLQGN